MSPSHNSALSTAGVILYGLVAGFAAAVAVVLGSFFLIFFAIRIFRYPGSEHAGELAAASGLRSVYLTVIPGLIAGVIVCLKVCTRRLRNARTS